MCATAVKSLATLIAAVGELDAAPTKAPGTREEVAGILQAIKAELQAIRERHRTLATSEDIAEVIGILGTRIRHLEGTVEARLAAVSGQIGGEKPRDH